MIDNMPSRIVQLGLKESMKERLAAVSSAYAQGLGQYAVDQPLESEGPFKIVLTNPLRQSEELVDLSWVISALSV